MAGFMNVMKSVNIVHDVAQQLKLNGLIKVCQPATRQ